jgi:hypothetical protein
VLLWLSALSIGCDAMEPRQSAEAATTAGSGQDGGEVLGAGSHGNAAGASSATRGQTNLGASDANTPSAAAALRDGGAAPDSSSGASMTTVHADAGMASNGSVDAAAARPDWAGLVTLDASITTAPDGAVISNDGGFRHYDPDAAGPVLNSVAQAACLKLADNICNRSADCQISLTQLPSSRRTQLVESCLDTLLLNHNCNRAIRTTSTFNACAEAVKTRDCLTVFADDFATACVDQITFQP